MARTVAQIEASIIAQKNAEPELAALTSSSATAIWRLWVKLVAYAQWLLEQLWDAKSLELDALAAASRYGTTGWWHAKIKAWQYGYSIIDVNGALVYLVIDEAAQLAARVAIVELAGLVQVKAAKLSGGAPVELSAPEQISLTSYINEIKPAGIRTQLVSVPADLIRVQWEVRYDGKLILADVQTAVEAAIEDYIANIEFDGVLDLNLLRDAVEALPAVVTQNLTFMSIKPNGGVHTAVTHLYTPFSGYYKIDPAFPLSSSAQINYVAV